MVPLSTCRVDGTNRIGFSPAGTATLALVMMTLVALPSGHAEEPVLPSTTTSVDLNLTGRNLQMPIQDPYSQLGFRWRVYCNRETGVAMRFPYYFVIPDQYQGHMRRTRQWVVGSDPDLVIETRDIDRLPRELRQMDFPDLARVVTGPARQITFQAFDYYHSPDERPHADEDWAPEGIEGLIGEGPLHSALVLRHGDQITWVVLTGNLSHRENRAILDTVEIMRRRGRNVQTWRQGNLGPRDGVLDHEGNVVNRDANPVPFQQAWEIETEFYHLTCQVSPVRTVEIAQYLETLHEAYMEVYDPDTVPPYLMEIHVFNTQQDFASNAGGIGIPVGPGTGGFFVPSLLCIFVFQESERISRTVSVERVLAHECSHQFLHVTCNGSSHVPTWINEGLAVYFESSTVRRGRLQIQSPTDRLQQLERVYASYNWTRMVMPFENYINHRGQIQAIQYPEVYAMTHYFVFSSSAARRRFHEYWRALKAGEDGAQAFERIFLEDIIRTAGSRSAGLRALEEEILRYVREVL